MRQPPAGFVERLHRTFGSDWKVWFDETVSRWAFESLSAGGKPVVQYWGWFHDANGNRLEPDPITGLHPFRDLDPVAQDEIIANLHKTYIGQTGHGLVDWRNAMQRNREHNERLAASHRRDKASAFADMLREVDLRRPWMKHHSDSPAERRLAMEGR